MKEQEETTEEASDTSKPTVLDILGMISAKGDVMLESLRNCFKKARWRKESGLEFDRGNQIDKDGRT